MSTRKINASKSDLKKMTQLELAMLLTADELKVNVSEFMDNDDIDESTIDAMLEALATKISDDEFAEFCESL